MFIKTLDIAISQHPFTPKGIKVSSEIFNELSNAGRVTMKNDLWPFNGMGPYLNDTIYIDVVIELNDGEFRLPDIENKATQEEGNDA